MSAQHPFSLAESSSLSVGRLADSRSVQKSQPVAAQAQKACQLPQDFGSTMIVRPLRGIQELISGKARREAAFAEYASATGLRPIDQTSENDVFVVGYPKSGNTWMQYLLTGACYGVDLQLVADALVQDLAPDVHFKKFYKPWFPVTFFKSHFLPRKEYRKVVYLLRDGRDAMVSYWHYLKGITGRELDFLHVVQVGGELFPCKWHTHVEQWMANPYGAQMITVRYEELRKDTVGQLQRICEFAGLNREISVLERTVNDASFSAMQKRESSFHWENPEFSRKHRIIRRGQIGSHKDEMPAAVLEAFLREAGPMMKKTGYLQ